MELNTKQRAWVRKMEERRRLSEKVESLWSEVSTFDDGVRLYFDPESDKMLKKKVRVLTDILGGKSPGEIGKDYFDILEGFDQSAVSDGQSVMVGDWEFNK